jgi:hypothetical protein
MINFKDEVDLPVAILAKLIIECSSISMATMLENRKKKK